MTRSPVSRTAMSLPLPHPNRRGLLPAGDHECLVRTPMTVCQYVCEYRRGVAYQLQKPIKGRSRRLAHTQGSWPFIVFSWILNVVLWQRKSVRALTVRVFACFAQRRLQSVECESLGSRKEGHQPCRRLGLCFLCV